MTEAPPPIVDQPANASYQPLTFNPAKFEQMLDGYGLTDAQKQEYLQALWLLVLRFVDLKMPLLFENSCGQGAKSAPGAAHIKSDMVKSNLSFIQTPFKAAANSPAAPNNSKEAS